MREVLKKKIGVLGGGQLGRMLMLCAYHWDIQILVMDASEHSPSASLASEFVVGDITDFNHVMAFGMRCEIICIEIESVNLGALYVLKQIGKTIFPDPDVLRIIKDKTLQKLFYTAHNIATAPYQIFSGKEDIYQALKSGVIEFPFIQKTRFGGYDGKGVVVIRDANDIAHLLSSYCIVEKFVHLQKELSVIAFRNKDEKLIFEPIEMFFHPNANLLRWQIAPADIDDNLNQRIKETALKVFDAFNFDGMLAIEFFLDEHDNLYVNEASPRPHNSGHHTIESVCTSQYEQYLRVMLDLPLGDVETICSAALLNILGREDNTILSPQALKNILSVKGAKLHLYGKKDARLYRKMGHVTVIDKDRISLMEKIKRLSEYLN